MFDFIYVYHSAHKAGYAAMQPLPPRILRQMKSLSMTNKFRKAVVRLMEQDTSATLLSFLRWRFDKLDHDGDGKLSLEDMRQSVQSMTDFTPDKLENLDIILTNLDTDLDGFISFEEWHEYDHVMFVY